MLLRTVAPCPLPECLVIEGLVAPRLAVTQDEGVQVHSTGCAQEVGFNAASRIGADSDTDSRPG